MTQLGRVGAVDREGDPVSGPIAMQPIPVPASMPTTVHRAVHATSPAANSTNNPNVDDRRNTGRTVASSSRQLPGKVRA